MPRPITRRRIPWQERPFVTVQEAAELLFCSQSKIYRLADAGQLGSIRVEGKVGIKTADILARLGEAA